MVFSTWVLLMAFALGGLLFPGVMTQANLMVKYCSGLNTGSSTNRVVDEFQSHGACSKTCRSDYAFAVIQGFSCWCSDYIPADTTSTEDCSDTCPGFGTESCGSTSKDLYVYLPLVKPPSGTQGAASSTAESSSEVSISAETSLITVSETVTISPSAEITPTTTASSTVPPTTTSAPSTSTSTTSSEETDSSSTSQTSTWFPTPVTSVMTITGELRTVTMTPTHPPQASSQMTAQHSGNRGFWSSAGKVAGLFVGLALIILLCAAGIILFCWRRHRRNVLLHSPGDDGSPPRSRSMSELGLIGSNRTTLIGGRNLPGLDTGAATRGTKSRSSNSPHSPTDVRRFSQARIVDQRLDPGALWNAPFDNQSRVSIRSLQDDQDYSRRVLRLANPDASPPTTMT